MGDGQMSAIGMPSVRAASINATIVGGKRDLLTLGPQEFDRRQVQRVVGSYRDRERLERTRQHWRCQLEKRQPLQQLPGGVAARHRRAARVQAISPLVLEQSAADEDRPHAQRDRRDDQRAHAESRDQTAKRAPGELEPEHGR